MLKIPFEINVFHMTIVREKHVKKAMQIRVTSKYSPETCENSINMKMQKILHVNVKKAMHCALHFKGL